MSSLPSENDLPLHLYHYTSINELEGILTKRCLWATQIHFLNDTQEYKYSIDILKRVIFNLRKEYPITLIQKALGPSPPPSEPKEFLSQFYQTMETIVLEGLFQEIPICVFSLSERGDLLSQWRGYCPPGGGYSIGFPSKLLIKFLETRNLYLKRCIYDMNEQEAMIKRVVNETSEKFLKQVTLKREEYEAVAAECIVNFFNFDFTQIATILKHPSFGEECEWRIISNIIPDKNMLFRAGKTMMIPYFSISFKDFEPFLIDEIIIGPAPEQRLVASSLWKFALQINQTFHIKTSETPYRQL